MVNMSRSYALMGPSLTYATMGQQLSREMGLPEGMRNCLCHKMQSKYGRKNFKKHRGQGGAKV